MSENELTTAYTSLYDDRLPLVSVVMPSYNSAQTVTKAVLSCVNQSYPNVEIIVVDNGSKDETAETVRRLCESYHFIMPDESLRPRIRLIAQDNKGVSAARNVGIKAAEGEWFMSLDSDDYYEPETIETLYDAVNASAEADGDLSDRAETGFVHKDDTANYGIGQNPAATKQQCLEDGYISRKAWHTAVSICGIRKVWEKDAARNQDFKPDAFAGTLKEFTDKAMAGLYDLNLIGTHSNKLYNTRLIRENSIYYNEGLQVNEDLDFVLRYLAVCEQVRVVPEIFLNYVQHDKGQSLINTFQPHGLKGALIVLGSCNALFNKAGTCDAAIADMDRRMFVHICSFAGLMYYRSGYENGRIKAELKAMCDNEDFRVLLMRLKPECLKDKIAHFLLKHKLIGIYNEICRKVYKNKD